MTKHTRALTVALLLLAGFAYGLGFVYGAALLLGAGAVLETWFWIRVVRRADAMSEESGGRTG